MKKRGKRFTITFIVLILFCGCNFIENKMSSYLSTTVLKSCSITKAELDSWFVISQTTESGIVNPPNNTAFLHGNNCDFYKWAEQIFLWITSPSANKTPVIYNIMMESSSFYVISPVDSLGIKNVVSNSLRKLIRVTPALKDQVLYNKKHQLTKDILSTKGGATIYCITLINVLHIGFFTKSKTDLINGKQFLLTNNENISISNFKKNKDSLGNKSNPVAIELKSSWIDASTLQDISKYITIDAIIPIYTLSGTKSISKGDVKAKLALIGIDIVGSRYDHPELFFARFEHQDQRSNFNYVGSKKESKSIKQETGYQWLLNKGSKNTTHTIPYMMFDSDCNSLLANLGKETNNLSNSNIKKRIPSQIIKDSVLNSQDISNSEIISINNSTHNLLLGNDVRKNYFFIESRVIKDSVKNNEILTPTILIADTATNTTKLSSRSEEKYIKKNQIYIKNSNCFHCHHDFNSVIHDSIKFVYVVKKILPKQNQQVNLNNNLRSRRFKLKSGSINI